MRILLLGEYSNVHWTLAEGLRKLGHRVCVVSDGDSWKNFQRDISLVRGGTPLSGLSYYLKVKALLPVLRNYDVVQLINPCFLELKAERIFPIYRYLRKHNRKMFLGGFGMDYYWVDFCTHTDFFRYSDFKLGNKVRHNERNRLETEDWLLGEKGKLNRMIAADCDGIATGLYEYQAVYGYYFPEKSRFIPFPINLLGIEPVESLNKDGKVRFFIGISKGRSEYKGTDIMYRALLHLREKYPEQCEIVKAEGVPYREYQQMMNRSDVLLDQLYSYTPAMNGLLAMGKGLVLVGGGEPENYEILGEQELRPIINVVPDEEEVFGQLEKLILEKERIPALSLQSVAYVKKHHDHVEVARRYLDFWESR